MEEKKALPDGIEWPRFTSGGLVGIDDRFTDRAGIERTTTCIRFYDSDFSICAYDGTTHYYKYGEPVAPAPVLAADGKPLEVGQTVWDTNGDELVIGALEGGGQTVACRYVDVGDAIPVHGMWSPSNLTHQRPVLDADGAEIRVGDTVYLLPGDWCDEFPCFGYHGGEKLEVFSLHVNHVEGGIGCRDTRRPKGTCYPQPSQLTHRAPVLAADGKPLRNGDEVWRVKNGDGPYHVQEIRDGVSVCVEEASCEFNPKELTHERPDSWERIEEDAGCTATKYNERRGTAFTTKQQVARDLVRRAKKLAGVSE